MNSNFHISLWLQKKKIIIAGICIEQARSPHIWRTSFVRHRTTMHIYKKDTFKIFYLYQKIAAPQIWILHLQNNKMNGTALVCSVSSRGKHTSGVEIFTRSNI